MAKLTVRHTGIRMSIPVKNLESFNGFYDFTNPTTDPYLLSLKQGSVVAFDNLGFIKLADGATDVTIGFLIRGFIDNDGGSNNTPGDQGLPVMVGNCQVITDAIVSTESFVPGDKLYAGTAANAGKVTKTAPSATSKVIGIASSIANATSPNLLITVA